MSSVAPGEIVFQVHTLEPFINNLQPGDLALTKHSVGLVVCRQKVKRTLTLGSGVTKQEEIWNVTIMWTLR